MKNFAFAMAVVACLFMPAVAHADNTTCSGGIFLSADGSPYTGTSGAADTKYWFILLTQPYRSYAVMTDDDSPSDVSSVTWSSPYTACDAGVPSGTVGAAGMTLTNITSFEPSAWGTSPQAGAGRWSLKTGATGGPVYFAVTVSGASSRFKIRVEDTTLFSNWFYSGGDYNAFTLLRNTTSSSVNVAIRWRNGSGTILATDTHTLPANGSYYRNGSDFAAVDSANSGTVEITHDGTPDAVVASTTVMSATTGLSFDAPFLRRRH